MRIERFEEIKAWQEARQLVKLVYKGSAAEIQSHLYVALDLNYINREHVEEIYDKADKVSRMLSNFIKYLKSRAIPERDQRDERV